MLGKSEATVIFTFFFKTFVFRRVHLNLIVPNKVNKCSVQNPFFQYFFMILLVFSKHVLLKQQYTVLNSVLLR